MQGPKKLAIALALLAASVAVANISEPALLIQATNSAGTATFTRPLSAFAYDPVLCEYSLDVWSPTNLNTPGGQYVARLNGLHIFMCDMPASNARIIMNFAVEAGATDTTFTITPGVVSFPEIPAAFSEASMSWAFTLADRVNSGDAIANLTGLPAGQDIYRDRYNGAVPFGYSVTSLQSIGEGAVQTAFDNIPPIGFMDVPDPISSIDSVFQFSLSHLDFAELQGAFVLGVPEPAGLALLSLGALLGWRRR